VLVWADVVVAEARVRVYGTHLTAGGGAAAASRDAQIAEIRARVAQDANVPVARTWVLAGDVNTRPGEASYELLRGFGTEQPVRDAAVEISPDAGDPSRCPTPPPWDVAAMAQLLADPEHVRRCGFSAGWPKDSNPIGCDLLSWCASWELRRDTSVRERIDGVFLPDDGRSDVVAARVPNRADPDWAAEGAQWYRLSDHLPVVVDLELVVTDR
jgi:endonuclease/exonuclease/phosphatase family metal-dependent hydrolase